MAGVAGRGLFAAQRLDSGQTFLDEPPVAVAHRSVALTDPPALSMLDNTLIGTNAPRLALRVALRVGDEIVKTSGRSETWEKCRHLCRAELPDIPDAEVLKALHDQAPETKVFTPSLWRQLMGIVHVNMFGFEDEVCLFAAASLLNHSCDPNAVAQASGTFSTVRPVDVGEELTISYCDISWSRERRQQWLWWAYGFECKCQRCIDDEKKD